MSDAVGMKRSTTARETPLVKPPDEAVWEAWRAKGRARDSQGRERCVKALTWGSVAALLVVAGLWSRLAPYEVAIRCVLAAAAAGMMMEAFTKQQYAFAVLFAGLAVLYNPVVPLFSASGNWRRVLVIASAVPFLTSLAGRDLKAAYLD